MRICYLAHVRLPTEKAHGAQIVKTCEALAYLGNEVSLLVPKRKGTVREDTFSYYGAKKNFAVRALIVPDFISLGPSGFALSLLWFSEAAKWCKDFFAADIIYSRDAFVLLQYVLLGRRFVYEAHMKPTVISRFVAKCAARVVVISKGLQEAYQQHGIPNDRIVVAGDAIDLAPFQIFYDAAQVRKELGMPLDKKIALYVGKIDGAKGVDTFAKASEAVSSEIAVVVVGDGPLKTRLSKQFPKVVFIPHTPYRDIARVLASADVLVIPNSNNDTDASRYTSPLKAFAYLASGKPIIASRVPALLEVFNDRNAFLVSPDDAYSLAEKLHEVLRSREAVLRAAKAKEDGSAYTWEARASIIHSALQSL